MFKCFNYKKNKKYIPVVSDKRNKFDLEGIKGDFYVDSVYDGDTITILIPVRLSIFNMGSSNTIDINSNNNPTGEIILNKVRVRLYGIDTPELKPKKNIPNREEHIQKANDAKKFLSDLILNKIIKVSFLSNDKYGRPLTKIYTKINSEEICINDLMITKNYAKKYDGGTKDTNFEFIDIEIS
jgi:endonuclease YncB( thermonuclease family)